MKSDPHKIESFALLSKVEMLPEKHDEIWSRLEHELAVHPVTHRVRRRRGRTMWASGAAAAAALVIAAGGIWSLTNRAEILPQKAVSTGLKNTNSAQQNHGKNVSSQDLTLYQAPAAIHRLSISPGAGAPTTYWPKDEGAVAVEVEGWLRQAGTVQYTAPSGPVPQGGPSASQPVLQFTTGGGQAVVIGQPSNTFPDTRTSDILVVHTGKQTTYIASKPLFNWLTHGQWQTQFYNGDLLLHTGNLHLGMSFASAKKLLGSPSQQTIVHGIGDPEWIYKQQGIILNGDPVWEIQWTAPYTGSLMPGIHIGSTKQAVKQAYPEANLYTGQGSDTFVFKPINGANYQIMIELANGRVSRMTIVNQVP